MGSRMEKKVTIVIPNYNGKRFLDDCLSSLERQTSKDFETLVIDNASQDDSVSYIREHYPWVKIAVMRHKSWLFRRCQCGNWHVHDTICTVVK